MPKSKKKVNLYTGQKVSIKIGGTIKIGTVVDIADDEFCIEYPGGRTEWVPNSSLV